MRIGITGTQCVGKTSLVQALQNDPEFKNYVFRTERSKYLRDLGIPLNTDSTIEGQSLFLAERAFELKEPKIITDRTIIDVMAFTLTAKSIPHDEAKLFCEFAKIFIPRYDYIFFIPSEGIEMKDNKVRATDLDYRKIIEDKIIDLIFEYRNEIKDYWVISGDVEERISQIKRVIFS